MAQVGFSEWTRDGRLRHPRFLGLRDDKAAREVVREMTDGSVQAGRREVAISHADRVLFPDAGLTKLDLARALRRRRAGRCSPTCATGR